MRTSRIRILFFLLLAGNHLGYTQIYNFRVYSVGEGLIQSQIYSVQQDEQANIWFGTGTGISIFNGIKYKNVTTQDGLPDGIVRALYKDKNGVMWVGTDKGACNFTGDRMHKFTDVTIGNDRLNIQINDFQEDNIGNMWIATSKMLVKYNTKHHFVKYPQSTDTLVSKNISDLFLDKQGRVWVGTFKGLSVIDHDTIYNFPFFKGFDQNDIRSITYWENQILLGTSKGVLRFIEDKNDFQQSTFAPLILPDLRNDFINQLTIDNKNNLWLATNEGAAKWDGKKISSYSTYEGLSTNIVLKIYQDHEGNMWFGTNGGGVCELTGTRFIYYTEQTGMSSDLALSILEDYEGNMWFGTYGRGIDKYDGKTFTNFSTKTGDLLGDVSWAIGKDSSGNIWLGTDKGLSKYYKGEISHYTITDGLISNRIWAIYTDSRGTVWIGSSKGINKYDDGKITSYSKEQGLDVGAVYSIYEDAKGTFWLGTNKGVVHFNGKSFSTFSQEQLNTAIFSIRQDRFDNYWFATKNHGIVRYNEKNRNKMFKSYTIKEGLIDNHALFLIIDDYDYLWLGTNRGLNRLNLQEYQKTGKAHFKHYGKEEGFNGIECIQGSAYKDSKGSIWIGTIAGVAKYNPKNEENSKIPPITRIVDVRLFFEKIDWSQWTNDLDSKTGLPNDLTLAYNENHLTFDFIGISLMAPEGVEYKYQLEGFDKHWSPVTKETQATYSNIPPGNYTFKILACNTNKCWNEKPLNFTFTISRPIWMQWWFYLICLVIVGGIIYAWIKIRLKNLEQAKIELEKTVQERTSQLHKKNESILDSIKYAKRIQEAILPANRKIKRFLPDSFIIYKPRDIVSGDFYWMTNNQEGKIFIAVIDCTGHGVPGAFMSMIGYSSLNKVVNEQNISSPEKILTELNKEVVAALKQNKRDSQSKDGMDLALCVIDFQNNILEYSGARRPLFLLRNNEIHEMKATKMSIGGGKNVKSVDSSFSKETIDLLKGDKFYMFSDGFPDQFGNTPEGKRKKYSVKQLKKVILDNQDKSFDKQGEVLTKSITDWKAKHKQTDDILMFGFGV